ncbi:MAG: NVEALA domain-containing protein [Tannerella sp.]|jgi:hypothetical protein|nr:NVEALA domain-containing protein [Tannerella sp.]
MKKKILVFMIVMAIVALAGWNVSQSRSEEGLSDVALENVEALAEGEATITCSNPNSNPYGGQCYEMDTTSCGGSWCGCRFSGYQSDFCYYG